MAFGEPANEIHITLINRIGYFSDERVLTPNEAIVFAKELIRRAKLVKKALKFWKKEGIAGDMVWKGLK